jgi:hypothetical protein
MHAEFYAFLKATELAEHYGMGCVIFATECLGLKQAVFSKFSLPYTDGNSV